jgi:hypothetical protein
MTDTDHRPAAPGDHVGLGRVVDNPSGLGHAELEPETGEGVEAASEDSFPASDPPGYADAPAAAADGREREATPPAEAGEADLPGTELPDRENPV